MYTYYIHKLVRHIINSRFELIIVLLELLPVLLNLIGRHGYFFIVLWNKCKLSKLKIVGMANRYHDYYVKDAKNKVKCNENKRKY